MKQVFFRVLVAFFRLRHKTMLKMAPDRDLVTAFTFVPVPVQCGIEKKRQAWSNHYI